MKSRSHSLLRPSLDKWSVMACKVSWPRQEGVKSLISPPQKKFLLEASLCWFPAFLPNALFLLIRALEYQGQLFPCHWHISCHSHSDISPPPHALLRSFQLFWVIKLGPVIFKSTCQRELTCHSHTLAVCLGTFTLCIYDAFFGVTGDTSVNNDLRDLE